MSTPTDENRLDGEGSPYLRQHADNPVNWQPWDEQALEAARGRDVPIFLSVGYSACHWCHVMEEESFADEGTAAILNEGFVPIKVDREERPDLDRIYQTICQMVSGQGGWPLSAWLTPEGKPFYVGTYFPPEARPGRPGFPDLLESIAEKWTDEEGRDELETRAEQWTSAVKGELEDVPSQADPTGSAPDLPSSPLVGTAEAIVRSADREHGGWGSNQKFPQPSRIDVLLARDWRSADEEFRDVAIEALDAMAAGGLYDHVGGGFHRYCVDRDWTVPHFEKMLYDNAELPRAFLAGHQVTGDDRYARVARETFAFLDRELSHPEGGFYSTLDARSRIPSERTEDGHPGEREEGAFYVWTPDEVEDAIDDPDLAALLCDRFGITESGNFEGSTVPNVEATVEELAAEHGLDPGEVRYRLDQGRKRLYDVREERPRPRRDEKVIAGWNGLAIRAYAEGAIVLEDDDLADRATDALAFVRDRLWDGDRLARRYADPESYDEPEAGGVEGVGYLEDYAFLGRGALTCYEATGEVDALGFALDLADAIVDGFWDDSARTLYFTPAGGEELIARPQEPHDQSTPSSLAAAVDLLAAVDGFTVDDRFGSVADAVAETHGSRVDSEPLQHSSLALATDRITSGSTEVTIAAEERPERWRQWLADRYLPHRLLAPRPPTDDALAGWIETLEIEGIPPIWKGREATDGPTAYVCRDRTCSRPLTDPDAADEWLDGER